MSSKGYVKNARTKKAKAKAKKSKKKNNQASQAQESSAPFVCMFPSPASSSSAASPAMPIVPPVIPHSASHLPDLLPRKQQVKQAPILNNHATTPVMGKIYGWTERDGRIVMNGMDEAGIHPKPVGRYLTRYPCTRKECKNVESEASLHDSNLRFKRCSFCLTIYCSQECNSLDFGTKEIPGPHKAYCKSLRAYISLRDQWEIKTCSTQEAMAFHVLNRPLPDDANLDIPFLNKWRQWIDTKFMKKVLARSKIEVVSRDGVAYDVKPIGQPEEKKDIGRLLRPVLSKMLIYLRSIGHGDVMWVDKADWEGMPTDSADMLLNDIMKHADAMSI